MLDPAHMFRGWVRAINADTAQPLETAEIRPTYTVDDLLCTDRVGSTAVDDLLTVHVSYYPSVHKNRYRLDYMILLLLIIEHTVSIF